MNGRLTNAPAYLRSLPNFKTEVGGGGWVSQHTCYWTLPGLDTGAHLILKSSSPLD